MEINNIKELCSSVEVLAFEAERLANMTNVLYAAMFASDYSAGSFDGAMHLFVSLMAKHKTEMEALDIAVSAFCREAHNA